MKANSYVSADKIRSDFSAAMSAMYRDEVPAYGTLMALVARVNDETLAADPLLNRPHTARPCQQRPFPCELSADPSPDQLVP